MRSLKAKRATIKPIIEGARHRFRVAVVAASEAHACDILDEVERFVWSFPEIEVIDMHRSWLEES